ncbi:MAG: hypothetical protein ACPLXM_13700 [Bacteroidales bacterium]
MISKNFSILMAALVMAVTACQPKSKDEETAKKWTTEGESEMLETLRANASQYGIRYPETFVLMQNRKGIRVEYCVDRSALQLWISPQVSRTLDARDQNFSNRDDHCQVFERITLTNLAFGDFLGTDYDAFHTVMHFKNQDVHIANLYDQPVILVWFSKDEIVDIKGGRLATPVAVDNENFVLKYAERGREFHFAAILGPGEGKLRQQIVTEPGRSLYTRAEMKARQVLALAADLSQYNIGKTTRDILAIPLDSLLAQNERKIAEALSAGQFTLKNKPEMQKLLDVNKRIALSMQDERGAMRSTNKYIYYLIWNRDGGMNTAHFALSGWQTPAKWQSEIVLNNPSVSYEEPKGTYYGQLTSPVINKFEEDGLFYVLWPTFLYWSQTGDDAFLKPAYRKNMRDAMDWLERYCYDKEKGLFFRYFYCETAYVHSRDWGWDNATGAPTNYYPSNYKGDSIFKAYDIYINLLNLANYWMLAAMETGKTADEYAQKAIALEEKVKKFFEYNHPLPSYGDLIGSGGKTIVSEPYGMDETDFQWALALPMFHPNLHQRYKEAFSQLYRDLRTDGKGMFLCAYNAILTSMDNEIFDEDSLIAALDYLVPQSVRPGKYLPMPYTIPEIVDEEDGDPFHDVRPLVYSSAPWTSAVTSLGVRRLPFGLAVRATKYLESLKNYEFLNTKIDFVFEGSGRINKVTVNGRALKGTQQIPENLLGCPKNNVIITMGSGPAEPNTLISSSMKLKETNGTNYILEGFGKNSLCFRELTKKPVLTDAAGKAVSPEVSVVDGLTYLDFYGRGKYTLTLL